MARLQLPQGCARLLHVQARLDALKDCADHLRQGPLCHLLVGRVPGQQKDIVDLSHGLEQPRAVDDDFIIQDGGQQGLDDLQLDFGEGRLAVEAVADGVNGAVDEGGLLGAILGDGAVRGGREVRVRDELADAVEGGRGQGYCAGPRGKL